MQKVRKSYILESSQTDNPMVFFLNIIRKNTSQLRDFKNEQLFVGYDVRNPPKRTSITTPAETRLES